MSFFYFFALFTLCFLKFFLFSKCLVPLQDTSPLHNDPNVLPTQTKNPSWFVELFLDIFLVLSFSKGGAVRQQKYVNFRHNALNQRDIFFSGYSRAKTE